VSWRAYRLILLGLFISRGVVLLCVIPPFEAWDEYQHVAYVTHLAETGERPQFGTSSVAESLLREVILFPGADFAVDQLADVGLLSYEDYWADGASATFRPPSAPVPLYQAQHGPLAYALMIPPLKWGGGTGEMPRSIAFMRLASLLAGALSVWILLGCFGRIAADTRSAGVIGLIVVLQPLFGVNLARVANDPLALLLASAAIVLCFEMPRPPSVLRSVLVGALVALAIHAKALNWMLVPFAVGYPLLRELAASAMQPGTGDWRRGGMAAAVVASTCLALIAPEILFGLNAHGTAIAAGDIVAAQRAGASPSDWLGHASRVDWLHMAQDYWTRKSLFAGGWSAVRAPGLMRDIHQWTIWLAALGWLTALLQRGLRSEASATPWIVRQPVILLGAVLLVVGFHTGLCYHLLVLASLGRWPGSNIWYAAAALPWFTLLVVQGLRCLPIGPLARVAPWLLVAIFAATNFAAIALRMIPAYSQSTLGRTALERLASLQPAFLGSTTLVLFAAIWLALLIAAVIHWRRLPAQPLVDERLARGPFAGPESDPSATSRGE
jgi:hypothetical protein